MQNNILTKCIMLLSIYIHKSKCTLTLSVFAKKLCENRITQNNTTKKS